MTTKEKKYINLLPIWVTAAALLLFAAGFAASKAPDHDLKITILHTNDLHSHDESFSEHGRQIGGLPRIGHLVRSIRAHEPNTVVIDAGDIFQGTPLFKRYHGAVEIELLNKIGYDLYTIGNHEFDDGPENLSDQLQKAKFRILNCNMDCSAQPQLAKLIRPMQVSEFDGQKVAFIGAITPDLNQVALKTGGVRIKATGSEWMKPIEEQIATAKKEGIKRIILVTHVGLELDKQLAEALPDLDAIVGGHSHTRLDHPIVVAHEDGSTTIIVQTGCYGRALGRLDLVFDSAGKINLDKTQSRLINITDKIPADKDLLAYVDTMVQPLLALREKIVGFANGNFENRFKELGWDSTIGDLVCDALVYRGRDYGVQLAFENRGGIRSHIERGPISLEKIEETLPFNNNVVFANVSGACIKQALEHSLAGPLGGSFLDEHGIKLAYDPQRPKGSRILFALVATNGKWQPLMDTERYKIAINDYSFNSGEGYNFAGATEIERTSDRIADAMVAYLAVQHNLTPEPPQRIVPVHEGLLKVEGSKRKCTLHVRDAFPGSKLTFVAGTDQGVEAVDNIPVPVREATVIGRAIANSSGESTLHLTLKDATQTDQLWFSVIIHPPKGTGMAKALISYPTQMDKGL